LTMGLLYYRTAPGRIPKTDDSIRSPGGVEMYASGLLSCRTSGRPPKREGARPPLSSTHRSPSRHGFVRRGLAFSGRSPASGVSIPATPSGSVRARERRNRACRVGGHDDQRRLPLDGVGGGPTGFCGGLLAVVSAIATVSQGRLGRRHAAVFSLCLMAIWVVVDLIVALIRGAL
jgi:hypothetical protein